jgi:hypothetical protein
VTNGRRHRERFPDPSQAATLILPHFFKIAGTFESAVDVGGGTGGWCAALKRLGVSSVVCVDHPDIRGDELLIDPSEFVACDMARTFPVPVRADLVLCLEFAEHLPTCRSEALIEFLTMSGNVVLFSAAIPGQPSPYHPNEQPAEFWRRLFGQQGFRRFDCVRPLILSDERLPYWYRQNLYVFASDPDAQKRHLIDLPYSEIPTDFEIVHSRVLQQYRTVRHPQLWDVPAIVRRSINAGLRRL